MRKVTYNIIPAVLWMIFIFLHVVQNEEDDSSAVSNPMTDFIVGVVPEGEK